MEKVFRSKILRSTDVWEFGFNVDWQRRKEGQQKLPWSFRSTQSLDKKVDKNCLGHLGQQKLKTRRSTKSQRRPEIFQCENLLIDQLT